MSTDIRPLTPERWKDAEALFESAPATRNCWCMWWRIAGNAWRDTTKASRKADFHQIAQSDLPPGLLAYDDDTPVGWVQITPRSTVPRFNAARTGKPHPGTGPDRTWVVTCFFTATSHRKRGLMTDLAREACTFAAANGAEAVEAAALAPKEPLQWSDGNVGLASALERAGFVALEKRTDLRVFMRWTPGAAAN